MAGRGRPNRGAAAEDALDLARRRLALAVEATGAGVYDHRVPPDDSSFRSERWAEILGYAAAELPSAERFPEWFYAQVAPGDAPRLRQAYADFLDGRSPTCAVEIRIRHKSGEWIWIRDLARAAARDDRGRVTRVVGVTLDITEQRRREQEREELLERERAARLQAEQARKRYTSVIQGLGCIVFEVDPRALRFTLVDGAAEDLLGYPVARWYEPGFWIERVLHPDDRPRLERAFRDAAGHPGRRTDDFRAVAADGREVWLRGLFRHETDEEGRRGAAAPRVRGIMVDVTEQRRLRRKERLLTAEVDHRTKNMLAAMQAMVLQTQVNATSVAEFAGRLVGRIGAMSRTHELLAQAGWLGMRVHRLVSSALEPFAGTAAVTLRGDDVTLPPRVAQALGLALHELATNAVRHGALSAPAGRLTVTTAIEPAADGGGKLVLRWVETGGPAVASPERRGFGSRLVERGLAYEAGGNAHLEFAPGGLRCYIEIPLTEAPESP